jgi:hypothetical protein
LLELTTFILSKTASSTYIYIVPQPSILRPRSPKIQRSTSIPCRQSQTFSDAKVNVQRDYDSSDARL